ncbi:MAG: hypothetical protein OHK0045_22950 [Raineya sp.]
MKYTFRTELNHKPNKNGLYSIFIRITQKKQSDSKCVIKRVDTGFTIKKTDWNKSSREVQRGGGVKASHPNAIFYNKKINELIFKGEAFVVNNPEAKIEEIQAFLQGKDLKPKNLFSNYIDSLKERNPRRWSLGTFENIINVVSNMNQYAKDIGIEYFEFKHIDLNFLRGLESSMYAKLEAQTSNKKMEQIRAIINLAREEGVVEDSFDPFKKYKFRVEVSKNKIFLSENDIALIENANFDLETLEHAKNFFLMQFYLAGKRVSDVLMMRFRDITDESLRSIDICQVSPGC